MKLSQNVSAMGVNLAQNQRCFGLAEKFTPVAISLRLTAESCEALSVLVPLLGCGEEAAILGFQRLGTQSKLDAAISTALQQIVDEERRHDALMQGLKDALPSHIVSPVSLAAIRRFHKELIRGGATLHLARIAGLDAAVCTILSRLIHWQGPLAKDTGLRSMLGQIRDDETRHVVLSRTLTLAAPDRKSARDAAAKARHNLAQLLFPASEALEKLAVDPDRLFRDLNKLPDGLLPA